MHLPIPDITTTLENCRQRPLLLSIRFTFVDRLLTLLGKAIDFDFDDDCAKYKSFQPGVRNSSQKWRRYVEKYIPMSLVKNKNTSYNLYIYSITYTNWVIIKQEGKNKLKQNSIPSLVPGSTFSLNIFEMFSLLCFT